MRRGRWARGQTRDEIRQHLTERRCWEVARRDDTRVARRLYRKQVVDGVYGWKVLLMTDAVTKIPLAFKVGKIQEHENHWTRALVTPGRPNLTGCARLHGDSQGGMYSPRSTILLSCILPS